MLSSSEVVAKLKSYSKEELLERFAYRSGDQHARVVEDGKFYLDSNSLSSSEIDSVDANELRDVFSDFSEDDFRRIINNPKQLSLKTLCDLLAIAPENILIDYVLKNEAAALPILTSRFSLAKPLIENELVFDLFSSEGVNLLLSYADDSEYVINLMANSKVFSRLSDSMRMGIIEGYFANYGEYYNTLIDEKLCNYLSSKKLAEFYEKYNPLKQEFKAIREGSTEKGRNDHSSYAESIRELKETDANDSHLLLINFINNAGFNFTKLVLFLGELHVAESEKVAVLKRFFPKVIEKEYEGKSFEEIQKGEMAFCRQTCKSGGYTDYGMKLLPDFEEFPYDAEIFRSILLGRIVDGSSISNSRVFFKQLADMARKKYGIDVNLDLYVGRGLKSDEAVKAHGSEIGIEEDANGSYSSGNNTLVVNINSKAGEYTDDFKKFLGQSVELTNNISTVFHEMRHARQNNMVGNDVSVVALAFGMELLLQKEYPDYYKRNYNKMIVEKDARAFGYYEACKVIDEFMKSDTDDTPLIRDVMSRLYSEKFISDRKGSKIGANEFMERFKELKLDFESLVPSSKVREAREEMPALKLVTNENGRFCSNEEIKERAREVEDPNTKVFYTAYLGSLAPKKENKPAALTKSQELKQMISEYRRAFGIETSGSKAVNK